MNTQMNLQRIPVEKLKPAKYNPRKDLKPGDPAYEKIKRSLHDFGYVDPVIWNEVTGNIVGGHQRYKVLVNEGATEIDCVVVHIENPQDEKALNIALNKAVGEWEPVALADLLSDLQSSGYDLGATGFDASEVDELFSKVHDKDVRDDDCDIDPEEIAPSYSRVTSGRWAAIAWSAAMLPIQPTWTYSWTDSRPTSLSPIRRITSATRARMENLSRMTAWRTEIL